MDILDTSAVRSISRENLQLIAATTDVAVSPISIFELLCHLDEAKEDETAQQAFDRRKGQLTKVRGIRVVHDPFAYHSEIVGAQAITNPTRFEDGLLVPALLEELDSSSSLSDFYGRSVMYPKGERGKTHDCCERVRQALGEEEARYRGDLKKIGSRLRSQPDIADPKALTAKEFWQVMQSCIVALAGSYQQDGIGDKLLPVQVCRATYMYLGYLLSRLSFYLRTQGDNFTAMRNDAEDAFICIYLDPLRPDILITSDHATIDALTQAIEAFNRRFADSPVQAECRVMLPDQWIRERLSAKA